jgi:N-acetylneuraminic acid mutarotase
MHRRKLLFAGATLAFARVGRAQSDHGAHGAHYESLATPGRIPLPNVAQTQRSIESPAPKAVNAGRWLTRAALPLPRSHAIGGAIGDTPGEKKSVDWHYAYDPKSDRWGKLAPLPTGRDHTGTVTVGNLIHVVGGRVDSFHTNSNLHHVYDAQKDHWEMRRPLPTARSGHGAALYQGKIFVMGGEGTDRVYGQNEAYDSATDRWEAYAPMPTPRHGLGAAVVGAAIHVAGGGPIVGGSVQSAVHEAFTLATQ